MVLALHLQGGPAQGGAGEHLPLRQAEGAEGLPHLLGLELLHAVELDGGNHRLLGHVHDQGATLPEQPDIPEEAGIVKGVDRPLGGGGIELVTHLHGQVVAHGALLDPQGPPKLDLLNRERGRGAGTSQAQHGRNREDRRAQLLHYRNSRWMSL